jgi:hypothetical protein
VGVGREKAGERRGYYIESREEAEVSLFLVSAAFRASILLFFSLSLSLFYSFLSPRWI